MAQINVLVAATSPDIEAEGISAAIAGRTDMTLVERRVLTVAEIGVLLESIPSSGPCALVLVGPHAETEEPAAHWLAKRNDLVVLRVDVIGDVVRIALRDIGLDSLLKALRELVGHAGSIARDRVAEIQLRSVSPRVAASGPAAAETPRDRPLLSVATNWIHELLREAVARQGGGNGDLPGLTVTSATVTDSLARPAGTASEPPANVKAADAVLNRAIAAADAPREPLAAAARVFNLSSLEFRVLLLALAPELDPRYQRCIGLLLDDLGRRVGTLGLYAALLGEPSQVRRDLAHSGNLARWRSLDTRTAGLPPADEPLRLDPFLAGWILGEDDALGHDPRARRAIRLTRWPGASLLDFELDRVRAASLVSKLQAAGEVQWFLLAGDDASGWRALLEFGAELRKSSPIRVDANRLTGLDVAEIEESGLRLGRMARLSGRQLILDVTGVDATPQADDALRLFFDAIRATGARTGVICADGARIVRLIGSAPYALIEGRALQASARIESVRAAAKGAEVILMEAQAEALANLYPLHVDGLEHAMRLARSRRQPSENDACRYQRFVAALKEIAAEGLSRLAERVESVFKLEDVVLPSDRKQQLHEIVDNIRLAAHVLDHWKFGEQLPYGRGVTALFHGPSGTGKTMAALGIARKLGIQILRIDLSRVVSKYIGDTEKNIDRVFGDAENSGCAILIDEAEALLGKRSEVKDAHDRYANIEVAYLLQRMEAYSGLAILTTNLRQNLDPAFLRRLRFIVDFPRPDAEAREKIWRRCLPKESHELDEVAFRQLGRRIDLTGGHIRQMTLRAAFIAAAAGRPIGLEHIVHAARAEFAKLGMAPVAIDLTERKKAA